MSVRSMQVTAWNNGAHHPSGSGYGVKLSSHDRDAYFRPEWSSVIIELEGDVITKVNTDKPSFWDETCRELISKDIGAWLIQAGKAPWPPGQPPKLIMEHISDCRFSLRLR